MAVITLSRAFSAPKSRPKRYKARDAAFAVGGNRGFYIASLPKPYPMTTQQKRVKSVAAECGIKPGIKKSDLMEKMVDCVGPKMRK